MSSVLHCSWHTHSLSKWFGVFTEDLYSYVFITFSSIAIKLGRTEANGKKYLRFGSSLGVSILNLSNVILRQGTQVHIFSPHDSESDSATRAIEMLSHITVCISSLCLRKFSVRLVSIFSILYTFNVPPFSRPGAVGIIVSGSVKATHVTR